MSAEIRGPEPDDLNFILATWLRGLYHGTSLISKHVERDLFMKRFNEIAKRILIRPSVDIKIACLKDDPDVILGYSILEKTCIHWVFVKEPFRKIGIARSLIPQDIATYSMITDLGVLIRPKSWKFNPFLVTEDIHGRKET